jgi:7-keto-8-aminopelargonate synthetase-like enzyme
MTKITLQSDLVQQTLSSVHAHGIGILTVTNNRLQGRMIDIPAAPVEGAVHFGNCSYLGLELDPRLKAGAIDAIQRFGTQFSSSRAYTGIALYEELEACLEKNFGLPVLATATTSLGHIAAIPVLVRPEDAVILDHQVHNSVQNAVQMVKANGTHVEQVRHNNMQRLEARIQILCSLHRQVWYMADGVYSMFGDIAPMKQIIELLNQYENFHCYIDDAHGMGWAGEYGCGQVLSEVNFHPRMILAGSMAKGFGSSGGFLVCPDAETKQKIRFGGSTMIFSGPITPAVLGASIASAKIMQTDELMTRQIGLQERIQYFIRTAQALGLPLVSEARTPIFFIGVGIPNMGYKICQRLIKAGFYTNIAVYPSVPYKNTGLRITLTLHHTLEDIQNMLCQVAKLLEEEELLQQVQRKDIFTAFGMKF